MMICIKERIGTEIIFTNPIKKTFQVETDNKDLAFGFAIDTIKRMYPNVDLSDTEYTIKEYKYMG